MFDIRVQGTTQIEAYLERVQDENKNLRSFWQQEARPLIIRRIARLFATGGDKRWPALKPATIRRKGNNRLLIDSGALYQAATGFGGSIERTTNTSFSYGIDQSKVPYAIYHEEGTSRLPKRPIFEFLAEDLELQTDLETKLERHLQRRIDNLWQ